MADIVQRFYRSQVIEQWDDNTRLYTKWNEFGIQTLQRGYTDDENSDANVRAQLQTQDTNRSSIQLKALAALTANQNFLELDSPTNAQALQQIKVLTRECSAIIRLLLDQLDTTDGT